LKKHKDRKAEQRAQKPRKVHAQNVGYVAEQNKERQDYRRCLQYPYRSSQSADLISFLNGTHVSVGFFSLSGASRQVFRLLYS
jgi:hypothetical protein